MQRVIRGGPPSYVSCCPASVVKDKMDGLCSTHTEATNSTTLQSENRKRRGHMEA
jgi:hypothetical protein